MPEPDLQELAAHAAQEVLETMFFTSILEEEAPDGSPADGWVSAKLAFRGARGGTFGIGLSSTAACNAASNFLGVAVDELSSTQVGEVVCEMANMVCGSILSRLPSEATFDLLHPDAAPSPEEFNAGEQGRVWLFALEEGVLKVVLRFE